MAIQRVGSDAGSRIVACLPPFADLAVLFRTLKGSVGLYGDIALSLETQEAIASLGKGNPRVAVPVIVEEMESLDLGDRKHDDYRMALISVIEGMGPAAEGAVPALSRIVQKEEVNEWVRFKAQSAMAGKRKPSICEGRCRST